jgi:hypothetical protein
MIRTLLLLVATLLLLSGCTVNQQFVAAVESAWDVIEPEYTKYVEDDPDLSTASKNLRKRTAFLLRAAILEAKGDAVSNLLLETKKPVTPTPGVIIPPADFE